MKMEERLRKARRYIGLTQCQMADELGIAQPTYSQFESGIYPVKTKYAELLRLKFGINSEWLLRGTGSMMVDNLTKVSGKLAILDDKQLEEVDRYIDLILSR